MQKKLLTIGELSKIKGVSIKSLRYYDKLGILKPCYINPDTNYRYYSIDQLYLVDLIQFCIELNIPLKNLQNYTEKNKLVDVQTIIDSSRENAFNQIEKLKKLITKLNYLEKNFSFSKKENIDTYSTNSTRFFLLEKYKYDYLDILQYNICITNLLKKCRQNNLYELANQGFLFYKNNDKIERYVYLEIIEGNSLGNTFCIKNKEYKVISKEFLMENDIFSFSNFEDILLYEELINENISSEKLQFLVSKLKK